LQYFRLQHGKQFALWLALAAMLFRALLPQGLMLEHRGGASGVELAICYASSLAKLRPDQGSPGTRHGHADCVFSAAAAPALPVSGVAPGFGVHVPDAAATFLVTSHLLSDDGIRPPVRGPPAIS
jgi:hypothetical protein